MALLRCVWTGSSGEWCLVGQVVAAITSFPSSSRPSGLFYLSQAQVRAAFPLVRARREWPHIAGCLPFRYGEEVRISTQRAGQELHS